MYAIIANGGKQYKVEQGDLVRVEKIDVAEGDSYVFDQVLALSDGDLVVGNPTVEGASVKATWSASRRSMWQRAIPTCLIRFSR